MTDLVRRAGRLYRREGLKETAARVGEYVYRHHIRTAFPRRQGRYNGVTVRAVRLPDSLVPWEPVDRPGYEEGIVDGIRAHATEGDRCVIVGGGWGVSAVVAGRQVGSEGSVVVYEGSASGVERVGETLSLNRVEATVDVRHAVVGPAVSVYGDEGDRASRVTPDGLPECDVLVLDCEGAEPDIIGGMVVSPRAVVVETHGFLDAPTAETRDLLVENGYEVFDETLAETANEAFCEENDIRVLVAKRAE